jgi:hypothetical protein
MAIKHIIPFDGCNGCYTADPVAMMQAALRNKLTCTKAALQKRGGANLRSIL